MDVQKPLTPAELAARLRRRLAESADDRPVCREVVDVATGEPEIEPLTRRSLRQRFSEGVERCQARLGLSRSNRWVLAMVAVVAAAAGLFVTVLSWPSSSDVAAVGDAVAIEEAPPTIVVSVAGAVVRPGIVELEAGARVADAIEAAGGLTEDAEIGFLNLARVVSDGDLVAVPDVAAAGAVGEAGGGAAAGAAAGGLVNVNVAGPEMLETLNGIGPVLAERIVEYREANGSFQSVESLAEVQGIGPRLLEQLRDQVTL